MEQKSVGASGCIVILMSIPMSYVLWSFTRMMLWQWFMVPFGLPPITMLWSLGLGCLIGSFTYRYQATPKETTDQVAWKTFGVGVLVPLFSLGMGWVWAWFGWML